MIRAMNRILLIFLLLITFNANSIAGSVMMSTMGSIDMGMHHDCDNNIDADTEMTAHCESDSIMNQNCNDSNCGACVYHCSNAVIAEVSSTTALAPSRPEFRYLLTEISPVYVQMLRPPQAV